MRILPLVFLLLAAGPFQAQDDDWQRFYPLEDGNTWHYEWEYSVCYGSDCDTGEGEEHRTIIGEIELNGDLYALMRYAWTGSDGTCEADLAIRLGEAGHIETVPVDGSCALRERSVNLSSLWVDEDRTISIGGISYEVDAVGSWSPHYFATDIGYGYFEESFGEGDFYAIETMSLVYAQVGGVEYGIPPVGAESLPEAASFALGAVYPNPVRTTATFPLTLQSPEALVLEVFDVLGRRVLRRDLGVQPAGPSQHRLGLGEVPAGLYIVRAETASGETATRRLVKVD